MSTKVSPSSQVLTLEVLVGHHQGLTSTQDQSERLKIGTESEDCGLALPACASDNVRCEHGNVGFKDGSWVYTALDGESFVDDVETTPDQEYPIKSGTVLTLGDGIEIKVTISKGVTDKQSILMKKESLTPASAKSDLSQPPAALRTVVLEIKLPGGGKSCGFECDLDNWPQCSVNKIIPGSAAEKCGIQVSDVIHKVVGKTVPDEGSMEFPLMKWEGISHLISSSRAGGKTITITIRRPPSYKDITDTLRYDVNTNLTKVREKFGAESAEYKKSKTQAVIETKKLEDMEKNPVQHWPDEPFVRFPYNPCSNLMANAWTYKLRSGTNEELKPKKPRKNRTKEIFVGKEEMKSLKFGLKSKWQPRHCYVKSCGEELKRVGMKPGMVVRAVDMVRCPPSGGPKQDGNAKDMVEAILKESVMLTEANKSVIVSVESVGMKRMCVDCCCLFCPCTWMLECITARELQNARGQVIDDCLCPCNCCCNILNEDFNICQKQRDKFCTFFCINCFVKLSCCPVTIAAMMAGVPVMK